MNETTRLLVETNNGDDVGDSINARHDGPAQYSFDSFRASARSISHSMRESMKRIGILGSVAIACNSLTGPAMLCLPATYQRSGLIPTTGMIAKIFSEFGSRSCLPLFMLQ